jgi:hypothetical protein
MKQYLICKCLNDDEYAEAEFTPSHFVLELTPEVIKRLKTLLSDIRNTKADGLLYASYCFAHGIWTQETEWLTDTFEEELCNWEDELSEPIEEHPYTEGWNVKIDRDGELRFVAYGKFNGVEFYTCTIDFQANILEEIKGEKL